MLDSTLKFFESHYQQCEEIIRYHIFRYGRNDFHIRWVLKQHRINDWVTWYLNFRLKLLGLIFVVHHVNANQWLLGPWSNLIQKILYDRRKTTQRILVPGSTLLWIWKRESLELNDKRIQLFTVVSSIRGRKPEISRMIQVSKKSLVRET